VASRTEAVAAFLRLARRHLLDRAYPDRPFRVRCGQVERAISTQMPAPAVPAYPRYPKTRVWKPIPPSQLFSGWPTVAHGPVHVARLRSQGRSCLITWQEVRSPNCAFKVYEHGQVLDEWATVSW
jgi:hypothetical protein